MSARKGTSPLQNNVRADSGPYLELFAHVLSGAGAGAGGASFTWALPPDLPPGTAFHLPAGYLDSGAPQGVSLTPGLRLVIR
ncbi:MAG: hypothetical protein AB1726_08990 [Planctomycetota bacterium]